MSRKCSDLCRCVNCHNTYGSRPRETKVCSRKRRRHTLQQSLQTSEEFVKDRGEKVGEGAWSALESIVLNEICKDENEDVAILKLYNDIVYYSTTPYSIAPLPYKCILRNKNMVQIQAKKHHIIGTK